MKNHEIIARLQQLPPDDEAVFTESYISEMGGTTLRLPCGKRQGLAIHTVEHENGPGLKGTTFLYGDPHDKPSLPGRCMRADEGCSGECWTDPEKGELVLCQEHAQEVFSGARRAPPLRSRRDYTSVGRKTFLVETLPPGTLPIYDKDVALDKDCPVFDEAKAKAGLEELIAGKLGFRHKPPV
jgi:hypothetical protein